jgi:hypothetical protein
MEPTATKASKLEFRFDSFLGPHLLHRISGHQRSTSSCNPRFLCKPPRHHFLTLGDGSHVCGISVLLAATPVRWVECITDRSPSYRLSSIAVSTPENATNVYPHGTVYGMHHRYVRTDTSENQLLAICILGRNAYQRPGCSAARRCAGDECTGLFPVNRWVCFAGIKRWCRSSTPDLTTEDYQ